VTAARSMRVLGLVVGLAAGLAGACGPKPPAGRITRDDAIVLVKSNVRDAQVFVNGRFVTYLHAAGGGIAVTPGVHRFELRHDDYFSSYLELRVDRAERRQVAMDMAPVLP
jgi:hypothetical protein